MSDPIMNGYHLRSPHRRPDRGRTRREASVTALTWTVLMFGTACPCTAQALTRDPVRVAWQLVDFVVFGDSGHGVQLLASPNLHSVQGRGHVTDAKLTLEPSATRRWALAVATLVDSVSRLRPRDRTPFVTVPLTTNLGRARLVLTFDGKGPGDKPFLLALFDSLSQHSWSTYASAAEIRDLMTQVDATAQVSVLDSVPSASPVGPAFLAYQLDHGPRPRNALRLRYPVEARFLRKEGRVLAEFIVDSTATVRPESFHTLLSDRADFSDAVRTAVLQTVFVPGERHGHPVNVLVREWFAFRMP